MRTSDFELSVNALAHPATPNGQGFFAAPNHQPKPLQYLLEYLPPHPSPTDKAFALEKVAHQSTPEWHSEPLPHPLLFPEDPLPEAVPQKV